MKSTVAGLAVALGSLVACLPAEAGIMVSFNPSLTTVIAGAFFDVDAVVTNLGVGVGKDVVSGFDLNVFFNSTFIKGLGAYEHRHGFSHERTVRPLPGQSTCDRWSGTGYERGGPAVLASRAHALRPTARPQGHRRETVCGVLALPLPGQHFQARHPKACESCVRITQRHPLLLGINAGSELARLRSVIVDIAERRVPPIEALRWIENSVPSDSPGVVVPDRLDHRMVVACATATAAAPNRL